MRGNQLLTVVIVALVAAAVFFAAIAGANLVAASERDRNAAGRALSVALDVDAALDGIDRSVRSLGSQVESLTTELGAAMQRSTSEMARMASDMVRRDEFDGLSQRVSRHESRLDALEQRRRAGDAQIASGDAAVVSSPAGGSQALLAEVYFASGSARTSRDGRRLLAGAALRLTEGGAGSVDVIGYSDSLGPADVNQRLSRLRAERVADLLVDKGVERERIRVTGLGERNAPVETPDGVSEPLNRRVVVKAATRL